MPGPVEQLKSFAKGVRDTLPDIKMPNVETPDVKMPDVKLPDLKIPDVKMSDMKMPDVKMPQVELPRITRHSVMWIPTEIAGLFLLLCGGSLIALRLPPLVSAVLWLVIPLALAPGWVRSRSIMLLLNNFCSLLELIILRTVVVQRC